LTVLEMVTEFAVAMGQPVAAPLNERLLRMRGRLIAEEAAEVNEALEFMDEELDNGAYLTASKADVAKELADLIYVVYGMAATFGIDIDEAVRRVHASNMSKLGPDGKPVYREDGKVLKPLTYRQPDMRGLWHGQV